ncbi:MAG: GatB/YqeY domain-containing protein, partial [Candidatus Aenigmatarchaeota archaeon]
IYKMVASFYAKQLKKTLNYNNLRLSKTGFKDEYVIKLIDMVKSGRLTDRSAELLLRELILRPQDPDEFVQLKSIVRISDEKDIEKFVNKVMADNPTAIVEYRSGKGKAFEFFVGRVMGATQGRGDPETIRRVLERKLKR